MHNPSRGLAPDRKTRKGPSRPVRGTGKGARGGRTFSVLARGRGAALGAPAAPVPKRPTGAFAGACLDPERADSQLLRPLPPRLPLPATLIASEAPSRGFHGCSPPPARAPPRGAAHGGAGGARCAAPPPRRGARPRGAGRARWDPGRAPLFRRWVRPGAQPGTAPPPGPAPPPFHPFPPSADASLHPTRAVLAQAPLLWSTPRPGPPTSP
jgi:hypothetical protein